MLQSLPKLLRSHKALKRPDFEQIALVLQGGGALGAYQAGVYQAIEEAGLPLDWIAGISIGAINAAIIAGNPPDRRLTRLRQFWKAVSSDPICLAFQSALPSDVLMGEPMRAWLNHVSAMSGMLFGVPSLLGVKVPPAWIWPNGSPQSTSLFDAAPLRRALEKYVDFDLINAGPVRLSVSAVNIRTGNYDYFDTATDTIRPEHILASAALPPNFPPVEIDGEFYWDGGLVSNTPLQWVADGTPARDTLVFQVDLWNTRGNIPGDIAEVITRQKEIQYASRTRASSDILRKLQQLRNSASDVLAALPKALQSLPAMKHLEMLVDRKVFRIVHLIYHAQSYSGTTKDFEFSRLNIDEHWRIGHSDAVRTLRHPEALDRPSLDINEGVAMFDVAVDGRL